MNVHAMVAINVSLLSPEKDQHVFDIPHVRALFIVLYTIVFIFCTFGNLAVVLVVIFHSRMRNITKFLLGNLAFANICVGIFCVYQSLTTYLYESWFYGDFMCKMHHFTQSLCHAGSILIHVAIAVERYLVLLHPFKSRQMMTLRRLAALITFLWISSAAIASPRLYYFSTIKIPLRNRRKETICIPRKTLYDSATADTIYFVLLYVFPLTIISGLYARIAKHLHRSVALRKGLNKARQQHRISSSRKEPEDSVHYDGKGSVCIRSVRPGRQSSNSVRGCGWRKRRSPSFSSSTSTSGRCSTTDAEKQSFKRKSWRWPVYKPVPKPMDQTDVTSVARSSFQMKRMKLLQEKDETLPAKKRTNHNSTKRSSWPGCHAGPCIIRSRSDPMLNNNNKSPGNSENIQVSVGIGGSGSISGRNGTLRRSTSSYIYHRRLQHGSDAMIQLNQRLYAIRVLVVIVMTFALLNLPYHVRKLCLNYLPSYDADSDVNHILTPLTFLLMYANCAVSPILYAFLNKRFRQSLLDLIFMWRKPWRGGVGQATRVP